MISPVIERIGFRPVSINSVLLLFECGDALGEPRVLICGWRVKSAVENADVYVSVCALDDPEALAPEIHIWTSDRLAWFETADELPRYRRFRADGA